MFMQFAQICQHLLLELKNLLKILTQDMVMPVLMTITLTFHFHQKLIVFKLLTFANFTLMQVFSLQHNLLLIIQPKSHA